MEKKDYILKSAASFRKKFGEMAEEKKAYGKKTISVFFDFSFLDQIGDIPADVKIKTTKQATLNMERINPLCFGTSCVSNEDGFQYYVDYDGETYNIIDDTKGKLLYSVIKITGVRFCTYRPNIYGIYDGLPVKNGTYNWEQTTITKMICDLYFKKEELL